MREVYAIENVAATLDLADIRRSYFSSLFPLNPACIVPRGPDISDMMGTQDTFSNAKSSSSKADIFHTI
jgi:glutathionyl-hydroquinone reductase